MNRPAEANGLEFGLRNMRNMCWFWCLRVPIREVEAVGIVLNMDINSWDEKHMLNS